MRILLLLLLFTTLRAEAKPMAIERSTGIVRVGSTYEGDSIFVGSGTVISYRHTDGSKRIFLATCAHLTGGQNPQVAGAALEHLSLGRRTDAFRDLDLIELDPKKININSFSSYRAREVKSRKEEILEVNPRAISGWQLKGPDVLHMETRVARSTPALALVPPWSARELVEPNFSSSPNSIESKYTTLLRNRLSYNRVSGDVFSKGRIAPGMSCAPLIKMNESGKYELKGLGKEFKNHMSGSAFASDRQILKLLNDYLENKPAESVPAQWHIQNGLLYQKILGRGAEIVPGTAGNGISTPPGNRKMAYSCKESSPEKNWSKINSAPALSWDGKQVMGFRIQASELQRPILIYPNHTGIELRLKAEKAGIKKVEDILLGASILSELDARFSLHGLGAGPYVLSTTGNLNEPQPKLFRTQDRLKIVLYGDAGEEINFVLNEKGAVISPKASSAEVFYPVIEVPNAKGESYLVDLTNLFHLDLSRWELPLEAAKSVDPQAYLAGRQGFEKMAENLSSVPAMSSLAPTISYRKKCGPLEREFKITMQQRPPTALEPGDKQNESSTDTAK